MSVLESDGWARLDSLLQAALDLPTAERARFVEEACGDDAALKARLTKLVRLAEEDGELVRPGGALTDRPRGSRAGGEPAETVPLSPGQRLGRYEIRDLLGEGGMGRVYRALDPTLDREVAIKALGGAIRDDSASLRRFEREARVLANLSHPNIAAIYGFELLDGSPYLILERVEGETLAQRLKRGALPQRDAYAIAIQVAGGLAEAHAKGITHRDLKPSNVMLSAGGRVKLVDFGLAKTTEPQGGEAPVKTNLTTRAGTIVGTAPYMSPEQVHGEAIDTRTDVWAFGCLLYEMLAGHEAFRGRSVPEVLAAVLRDEPDWGALPEGVPWPVRRLLKRCLRKDPNARIQHIGDARLELVELGAEEPQAAAVTRERLPRWMPWAAAVLSTALAAALLLVPARRAPAPRALFLSLELPHGMAIGTDYYAPFAISPTGSTLVVDATVDGVSRLYARALDDLVPRVLPGTEEGRQPFFSPDGRWVAFYADRKLKKVPLAGGPAVTLCDIGNNARGGAWSPDGTIVVAASQTSGLMRVPEGGGRLAPLTLLDVSRSEYSHRWPDMLPGGEWVLFTAAIEGGSFDEARIDAVSLKSGERRALVTGAGFARYLPGFLVFVRGGRLFAVPFDADRVAVKGSPELVLSGVRYEPQNGAAHVATSATGALVYGPGVPASPEMYLSWLHRDGRLTRLVETPRAFRDPRLSPDGSRVAVVIGTSSDSDLWLVGEGGALSRVSFGLTAHRPAFTPDGRHITVSAEKDGRWRLLTFGAEGGGEPAVLLESAQRVHPNAWSPDGRSLVFQLSRPETGWDLMVLEVDAAGRPTGAPRPFSASPFNEANASISLDGRYVVYESDEVDALVQAHVRSFPDGGHKVQASTGGARWPTWGKGGDLTFRDTSRRRFATAATRPDRGGGLVVEEARTAFGGDERSRAALARVVVSVTTGRFDLHPSGERLLVLETSAQSSEPPLARPVIALDWAAGLRAGR